MLLTHSSGMVTSPWTMPSLKIRHKPDILSTIYSMCIMHAGLQA